ncbi:protein kinase domain-containing protein [Streptomyces zhihengii]
MPPRPEAPRFVGPYRVLARLGSGGMGEVHLAADERRPPDRTLVAVKTVRRDVARQPGFRDRFRREIGTGRLVGGRYTARLLDGDPDAESPWLATEYVPGPTLEQVVREAGPLPEATVRRLGLDLVRALRSIHHAQVLHRDLKPANVLLTAEGPKVIDFGIARDFGASTMTDTGVVIGSPGFMSPEHVAGSRRVVAASDVFCLAAVLCWAATGRTLFGDGPLPVVLYRIAVAETDAADVPPGLLRLLDGCLHRDASARPDTAELERRLADAAGDDDAYWPDGVRRAVEARRAEADALLAAQGPVTAHPPTAPGRPPRPAGLHDAPTVGAAPAGSPARPWRRRAVRAAVAVVLVVSAVAGARAYLDDGGGSGGGSGSGSGGGEGGQAGATPAGTRAPAVSSVDALGGSDRSRVFALAATERPRNWKPWSARLPDAPAGCAADPALVVCRLADGSVQALRSGDGKALWRTERPDTSGEPAGTQPAGTTVPLVAGALVVSAEEGRLRGRAVADGRIVWDVPLGGRAAGRLIGVEGRVFALRAGPDGLHVGAHRIADGARDWTRQVAGPEAAAGSGALRYGAHGHAAGLLYANTERGLESWDTDTGSLRHLAESFDVDGFGEGSTETRQCPDLRLAAGQIFCPDPDGAGLHMRAAEDLSGLFREDTMRLPAGADPRRAVIGAVYVGRALVLPTGSGQVREIGGGADEPLEYDVAGPGGRPVPLSVPVLVGTTVVFADDTSLYTRPQGGEVAKSPVRGAPGGGGSSSGRGPELLSVGGTVLLAYGDGTVASTALPGR